MTTVCFYFKVHQPYRLKVYSMKGVNLSYCYADVAADKTSIDFLADNSYLPANELMYRQIIEQEGRFKINYSISGTALELFQKHRPDVISSFQQLVKTGCVEILAETYYHSLSSLHSVKEFQRQVVKHAQLIGELFGIRPVVFRNTEMVHSNSIAQHIAELGFRGLLCEGVNRILHGRSPNHIYSLPGQDDFGLLLRNASLSDDIAFRFDDANWSEHPLMASKFAEWLHAHPLETSVINLMMDYETFGVHKKTSSGIFEFLDALPAAILSDKGFQFSTASAVLANGALIDTYDVPEPISWENNTRAACVWCHNMMQHNTLKKIYSIEKMILDCGNPKAIEMWGRLQSADYFYYMSEESCKRAAYKYHNPFSTTAEAFQNYSNIVADLEIALIENEIAGRRKSFSRTALINALL